MRILLIAGFIFAAAFGSAQFFQNGLMGPSGPPWNSKAVNYWGMGLNTTITGFTEDRQVVSGTKVEFTMVVSAGPIVTWAPTTPTEPGYRSYNRIRITNVTLKIGTETVYSGAGSATAGPTDGVTKEVRYASTQFNDGSDIPLTLNATAHLTYEEDGQTGQIPPPHTLECPTLIVTNVAYNKGLTLATKEEYYKPPTDTSTTPPTEYPEGYYVVNPPFPDGYAKASQDAMPAARAGLKPSKHTILNGSDFLTEAELAGHLKAATCFFGFTHGETTNFRATQSDALLFFPAPNELHGYVQTGRTAPKFNLVVMHACWTIGGSGNLSWQAPVAFQVANYPPNTNIPNKAYAGFSTVVWSLTQKNFSLKDHAEVVYSRLAAGDSIELALKEANNRVLPKSSLGKGLSMLVRGDKRARLFNVYVSEVESPKGLINDWKWVR